MMKDLPSHEQRWVLFLDFAATIHETLTDVIMEMETAKSTESVTPAMTDKLEVVWSNMTKNFTAFAHLSQAVSKDKALTPQQASLAAAAIKRINELAQKADSDLRALFQETGLMAFMLTREDRGEPLWKDVEIQ